LGNLRIEQVGPQDVQKFVIAWRTGQASGTVLDLRRLNATTLVVGGVDVKTAQVRLGHSDPRMTLAIYASAPVSADRAAAETVDQRFFGAAPGKGSVTRSNAEDRAIFAPKTDGH
jgi:hypothetical protein